MTELIHRKSRRLRFSACVLAGIVCGVTQNSLPEVAAEDVKSKGKPTAPQANTVVTYPGPDDVAPSNQYSVKVKQGGTQYESFVYLCNSQQKTNRSKTTSWTTFSCSGPVTVVVTKLKGEAIKTCKVLRSSYGIEPRTEGNTITFQLDRPRKVSVEFDDTECGAISGSTTGVA